MKKIMIALGAALVAGLTQAASLNWALSQVNKTDSSVNAGGAVYMFLTAAGGDALSYVSGASVTTIEAVVNAVKDGSFTGAGAYVATTLNSSGGVTAATGITSFKAGDSLSAFAIIFDDADASKAKNYMIAENASGVQVQSTSWTSATGAKTLIWGSQSTNGTTWTAVPEPTSGLLMLLGMAGLALRRRRA